MSLSLKWPSPLAEPDKVRHQAPSLFRHSGALAGRALDLWHLCSLDAPTVGAVWVIFAATCAKAAIGPYTPVAMFVAVWMLYAGDRLLDSRSLRPSHTFAARHAELEQRHRFHHRYRAWFTGLLPVAGGVLAWLACRMPRATLHGEAEVGVVLLLWLTVIHVSVGCPSPRRLPKEWPVGLFFAAAAFLPSGVASLALWPGALLFACTCTLNCLFLYAWEHPCDRSRAHAFTLWGVGRVVPLAVLVLLGALALATDDSTRGVAAIAEICALSTALLLLLHRYRHRYAPLRLRAMADVTLLTPVLFWLLARRLPPHDQPF